MICGLDCRHENRIHNELNAIIGKKREEIVPGTSSAPPTSTGVPTKGAGASKGAATGAKNDKGTKGKGK